MARCRQAAAEWGEMLRFLGWLFTFGTVIFLGVAAVLAYVVWDTSKGLPDYKQLAQYEPPVMTRIHAADGSLLAEYYDQRRQFVPISAVPRRLVEAFVSAEDKTFFEHGGLDWQGIAVAGYRYLQVKLTGKGQIVGASTITQQVAKNFLLGNEKSLERKLREAMIVQRIERAFSKDKILELYLNEIFFGFNSYGIAAASLNYFGKSLNDLTLDEMAYLAALPKGPNNYHPFRNKDRAIERRNWVLGQMHANGYITEEEMKEAQAKPLEVTTRPLGAQLFAAESFSEEVRRELIEIYGEGSPAERRAFGPDDARSEIADLCPSGAGAGLIQFDRKRGYRGPIKQISVSGDWGQTLGKMRVPADIAPWRLAVVLETNDTEAVVGIAAEDFREYWRSRRDAREGDHPLGAPRMGAQICRRHRSGPEIKAPCDILAVGDVIYVAPDKEKGSGIWCKCPTSKVRWLPWTRIPAACWRWSAASPMARASSTARSRRCGSPVRHSSHLSTPQPSTMAIRRHAWCSTHRSNSRCRTAKSGSRRITRTSISVLRRCAAASSCPAT